MKWIILVLLTSALGAGAAPIEKSKIKQIYTKQCAICHGKDGKGNTRMGKRLHVKDYTNPDFQKTLKDEHMAKVIKEGLKEKGRTFMKPFSKLTKDEIKGLVVHMREFKKK